MGQEPHYGRGAGGVPVHPDAGHASPHPAVPVAASLLFHQLLPRHVPRRSAPHCGHCLLPYSRCVRTWGSASWEIPESAFSFKVSGGLSLNNLWIRSQILTGHCQPSPWNGVCPIAELTLNMVRNRQGVCLGGHLGLLSPCPPYWAALTKASHRPVWS